MNRNPYLTNLLLIAVSLVAMVTLAGQNTAFAGGTGCPATPEQIAQWAADGVANPCVLIATDTPPVPHQLSWTRGHGYSGDRAFAFIATTRNRAKQLCVTIGAKNGAYLATATVTVESIRHDLAVGTAVATTQLRPNSHGIARFCPSAAWRVIGASVVAGTST